MLRQLLEALILFGSVCIYCPSFLGPAKLDSTVLQTLNLLLNQVSEDENKPAFLLRECDIHSSSASPTAWGRWKAWAKKDLIARKSRSWAGYNYTN